MVRRSYGWRFACLFTIAAWAVYALHWPLAGAVIPWDAKDFYYPALRALAAARAAGESGFWNPDLYAGYPAIADPQSWLFTPGFRLLAELNAAPSMMLMDAVQLLHVLAGGLGVILLMRWLGFSPLPALLAALVFMFGGVAASRLQHSLMTVSYAYLPWALWLLHRTLHDERLKGRVISSLWFGIVAGVMAVDRDQTAFLNCWLLIGATLWWLTATALRDGPRRTLQRLAALIPAVLAGLALLAIPMLLTLDALASSTRPEIGYELAGYGSQQPASVLTLLAPNFFGTLDAGSYWGPGQLPWMALSALGNDWTDETTNYLYIGVLPLALLLMGLAQPGRWPRHSAPFASGALFALLYALGAYTPVFRWFYDWLPGVALYRRPNDAAFALNAMLALLVGCAAQKWMAVERHLLPLRCAAIGGLLVVAAAAALWLGIRFGHERDAALELVFGLGLLAAGMGLLLQWHARTTGFAALALCGLTTIDLIAHNAAAPFNAHAQETIAAYRPAGESLAQDIKARLGRSDDPYRAEIFGLGGDWQNAPMVYGIEQTLGYNPLRNAAYAAATGALQNSHDNRRDLTGLFTGYDSVLAQLLGIRLVATGAPIEDVLPASARTSLRFVGRSGSAYLYENEAALPRVMVVGAARPDVGQALPDDPQRLVLIAGLVAPVGDAAEASPGTVRILARASDGMRIAATLTKPGYVLVNDMYHPAWMATLNGEELPVLRANRFFRAVALPAGDHEVVFRFRLNLSVLKASAERLAKAALPGVPQAR